MNFLKKTAILSALVIALMFVTFLLAAVAKQHTDEIVMFGLAIEGMPSQFLMIRLIVDAILIFYWKELVRAYGRWKRLNLRQIYSLKTMYPYTACGIVGLEIFNQLF